MAQATQAKGTRRKELYYFDLVVFQVEDALFKLPKNHFAASSVFATIFTLPPGEEGVEGTEEKPFVLQGIGEIEFECLLKVMYPPPLNAKLTRQEWMSVLKLSTMWEFTDIREMAIQELLKEDMGMQTIEKIECAKSFRVKEWLVEGYTELLKRAETITDEEGGRLGWETAAKLLLIREQYLTTLHLQNLQPTYTCSHCRRQSCVRPGTITIYNTCQSDNGVHSCTQNEVVAPNRNKHDFTQAVQEGFEGEWY
jgi:hypothetical protein